ncbi:hypothetical protein D3C85_1859600 [compost metagenome]
MVLLSILPSLLLAVTASTAKGRIGSASVVRVSVKGVLLILPEASTASTLKVYTVAAVNPEAL